MKTIKHNLGKNYRQYDLGNGWKAGADRILGTWVVYWQASCEESRRYLTRDEREAIKADIRARFPGDKID